MRRTGKTCTTLGIGITLAAGMLATGALAQGNPDIDKVKAAVERFQDINVAMAEGYISPDEHHCVSAEAEGLPAELGAMGIHLIRPDLLQITATAPRVDGMSTYTDWELPAILIYEPQADGSFKLVGAENLVFIKAWEAAGNTAPPTFAGRPWDLMADDPNTPGDEAHGFEPHYDQHVWFVGDAAKALDPFNTAVSCANGGH